MSSITQEDKSNIKKLYGTQAANWAINETVYIELVKIIQSSKVCTQAMHFVPRPLIVGDPVQWLQKEVLKNVIAFFVDDKSNHYVSCLTVSALARKTAIFLASQGIK